MSNIFVILHHFIAKHKIFFSFFLIFIVLGALFSLSKLKLKEDIRAIIPQDDRIEKINNVIKNSKFAEQLVFTFSLINNEKANPNILIQTGEFFVDLLKNDTSYVQSINFKNNDEKFLNVYDFIYNNIPFYLSEKDYVYLEKQLTPDVIEKTLENNYKSLSSLVGLVTKNFIFKDPLNITPLALKKLENFQLDKNFIIHNSCVFTKDKKQMLLFLQPKFSMGNTKENQKLIVLIEDAIKTTSAKFNTVNIEYYGGTAVAVDNATRIKKDIMLTVSIAIILLFFLVFLIFKKLKVIILIFLPIALGMILALAFIIISGQEISAIALGIGAILIGISIDYSLHAFTHYRSCNSEVETLKSISTPIMMSSITTVSAFLSLYIVQSQVLKQLGLIAALTIFITALVVLTILPFLLKHGSTVNLKKQRHTFLDKIAEYSFEKNKWLLLIITLLSILFLFTSKNLTFNSDISSLNYLSENLSQAEKNLKSISSEASSAVYFVVQGSSFEEVISKTEKSETLFNDAINEKIITSLSSPIDLILSEEKQKKKIDRWNEFWDSIDRKKIKNILKEKGSIFHFNEKAFTSFYNLLDKKFSIINYDRFNIINDFFLKNYLSKTDTIFSAVTIIKTDQKDKDRLFEKFKSNTDIIIFDNQYFTNQFLDVLKDDFNLLVLISMLLVFTILLVFFGRIEIALITFFPISLSWLWTIGIMGLFGIQFNIFNIIISTFILGLGVDYSIFIMSGLINNYKYSKQSLTPYKLSILLSALTTIICLGVIIFAKHPALKSIALVSIIGIISVIIITYSVLPIMFTFLIRNKGRRRIEPVNMLNFIISVVTLFVYLLGVFLATISLPVIIILPVNQKFKKLIVHYLICKSSKIIVYLNITIKKKYVNKNKLDFSKPVIFISNHQSHLDLVLILLINPKIIVLTNNWVWNSPYFGFLVRYVGFYPAFKGLNYGIDKIEKKVKEGYSVLIFPEGNRTIDGSIRRFHQGAFYLADRLNLEIQPIIIHGAVQSLAKNEFFLKSGDITLTFFDRFKPQKADIENGESYKEQAKKITKFYRTEFEKIRKEIETPHFFKRKLIAQYIYKGPVLEWYLRVKLKFENYYTFFNQIIPPEGNIMDIGCGYGFLAYMLNFVSKKRNITGIDYDNEKIGIANNCVAKSDNINFVHADIFDYEISHQDAFIISDVLHYFNEEKQEKLIVKCINHLNPKGVIIIRDADSKLKKRHWGTRYTEFFSTKSGFNKLEEGKLFFTSSEKISEIISRYNLQMEIIDSTKLTSNIVYVIRKKE